MWARDLPPDLTILFLLTTIRSIDKAIIKRPKIKSEIPFVDENGDTNVTEEPDALERLSIGVGAGEVVGCGVGEIVGVGLGFGARDALAGAGD